MEVEVGLHQASPPPSYSGYWPLWMFWEYAGTFSSMPSAPPSGLTGTVVRWGTIEAIAPTERSVGRTCRPGARYSVTRSWYDVSVFLAMNVSMSTLPLSSAWPGTVVRLMSPPSAGSSEAQRPITYHLVSAPAPV